MAQVDLWFQDETRIGQQGSTRRMWAKKGTRPGALKQQQLTYAYLYGAPEFDTYESKLLISLLVELKNAPTSTLFVVLAALQSQTNPSVPGSSWRVQIPTASDAASLCGVESDA